MTIDPGNMPSIVVITYLVGLGLIVIALLGGITIKEITIPQLPAIPRILTFFAGCVLLAICLFRPDIFQLLSENKTRLVSTPNPAPSVNRSVPETEANQIPPSSAVPPTPVQPSTLPQPALAQPSSPPKPLSLPRSQTSWYVMLGSFNANNGDFAVNSAKRVKNKASEECHVSARTELTSKIEGFTPGYVSTFLGPYETQEDAVADKETVLPCVPKAYIKSIKP
ncbi:MAG: SPOR domain-containing protein [Methylocella sp.]